MFGRRTRKPGLINDFGGPCCPCCGVSCGYGRSHHKCDCRTCSHWERVEQERNGFVKPNPNQAVIEAASGPLTPAEQAELDQEARNEFV